ncbi:MAG: helix-turn-helix transcriptional regulator [Alphaproteobacteria bacterium]
MIAPEQIKAARALLKWRQSELAKASGVSLPSINNIERALGSPRVGTMQAIENALSNAGIVFSDNMGVALHKETFEVQRHHGPDFIRVLNRDIYSCMRGPHDEIMMCNLDEREFPARDPEECLRYDAYARKTGFRERILLREGDSFFLSQPSVYRWLPPELIGTIPYLLYNDRFALLMCDAQRVLIVRNQSITDTFRRQFEFLWSLSKAVPARSRSKLDDRKFVDTLKEGIKKK